MGELGLRRATQEAPQADHPAGPGPVAGTGPGRSGLRHRRGSTASGTATAPRSPPTRASSTSTACWTWAHGGSSGSPSASTTTPTWPPPRCRWRSRSAAARTRGPRGRAAHRPGQRVHRGRLPGRLRPAGSHPVDGPGRVGAGQRGHRELALHRGVRAAPARALHHQGPGPRRVAAWIEEYNHDRRHSSLGMLSPIAYERQATADAARPWLGRSPRHDHRAPIRQRWQPSSSASRPRPPGGLRPALTPTPGDRRRARSGARRARIHKIQVSTVSGDCRGGGRGCGCRGGRRGPSVRGGCASSGCRVGVGGGSSRVRGS